VETPVEPHSLAPGKLEIGLFKIIPLGKRTSTLLVSTPLIDRSNPSESPPIEGGKPAQVEAAVPPPEVTTPALPPIEVASTAVPPKRTVFEEASFEMTPPLLESIEISLLPAKAKTLDPKAKAWLWQVIGVPASAPGLAPIALPSSVAPLRSLTSGRTSPSKNPVVVPSIPASPTTSLLGLLGPAHSGPLTPNTAPSTVPSADPAPASVAIPATTSIAVPSVPAVLLSTSPATLWGLPAPAHSCMSPSTTPNNAPAAVPYADPALASIGIPATKPMVVPSVPSLVLNCNQLKHDADPWWPAKPKVTCPDPFDVMVQKTVDRYHKAASWEDFLESSRDPHGDLSLDVKQLPHRAAHLLDRLRLTGAPVVTKNEPWSLAKKILALNMGPHASAINHVEFLRDKFVNMIDKGQWVVLPARLVLNKTNLRISPLGVVPQRDRRPRTISDYSFFMVNEDTVDLALAESMQFGRTLWRILNAIARANPTLGPVYLSKVDIADGFYRIRVRSADVAKLGVLLPTRSGEEPLVAFHLALPMVWSQSPPLFTSATESIADLANQAVKVCSPQLPHRLETATETPIPIAATRNSAAAPTRRRNDELRHPLQQWYVYVDDFIGVVQGNLKRRQRVKQALMHALDKVFRKVDELDNPHRQEPASLKKLLKGDATWSTRKAVLGWVLDTVEKTLELPAHRIDRLREILNSILPSQKRVSVQKWHKVLGEIHSMSLALPGTRGLLSVLQEALCHKSHDGKRLRLHRPVHDFLDDFRWLAKEVGSRPTSIDELVAQPPSMFVATDASGLGVGGVFFLPGGRPYMWRKAFPHKVASQLVTADNPTGSVSISDLELAGTVAQSDVMCQLVDVLGQTTHTVHDNMTTVWWRTKGSTTTTGPAAYLLQLQAIHQRHHRYLPQQDFIPGKVNLMADLTTRSWDISDSALLSNFNTRFSQTQPWTLCTLSKEIDSALTSALLTTSGVTAQRSKAQHNHWERWDAFCIENGIDPFLRRWLDPIPVLQVYGQRYRDGRIAPSGKCVRSRTVEDALRAVGQTFARLGAPDVRKDFSG
jgi:hypothetical protein